MHIIFPLGFTPSESTHRDLCSLHALERFQNTRISDTSILTNGTYQTGRLVAWCCTRSTSSDHVVHPKTNSTDVKMLFINAFPPRAFVDIAEGITKTTHMIITSWHNHITEHKAGPAAGNEYYTRNK